MIGRTVAHYEIIEKLGEGGMGVVYKAHDSHLDRFVALKFLHTVEDTARLLREAQAAASLMHPNICTVFEVDSQHGFLAMELIEGPSLREKIRDRPLKLNEALRIATDVASGLKAAHQKGVVHRDIKAANVLLTPSGQAKITDFGLALLSGRSRLTKAAMTVGTPGYMAPEQARGERVDRRADIWALGVVLYEMVAGKLPFEGDSDAAVIHSILNVDAEPLTALRSGLPVELDRIVAKCLAKDPGERYQHADDLIVDMSTLRRRLESGTRTTGELAAVGTRGARWWLLRVAGPLMVLLAVAVAAGVTWRLADSPKPAPATVLHRLTSDSGLARDPALSPDGKLLAYASDRSGEGNLDIWIRQVAGGEPARLTRDKADETEPAFSHDGTQIAFRSEREGGGIYVMPALGGAEPRLVAREGRRPRYSPDGKWIAYWTGPDYDSTFPKSYRMFVVPPPGGVPRQLQAEFDLARYPTWFLDSKHLLFYGSRRSPGSGEEKFDWWVTSLEGDSVVQTEALGALRSKGLSNLGDPGVWNAEANELVFSASLGVRTNLWRLSIDPASFKAAVAPERLTDGVDQEIKPSVAAAAPGAGIVFASVKGNIDLWSLPFDDNRGSPTGLIEQLTQDTAMDVSPSLSPDGRKLAFVSARSGKREIWVRDLANGMESLLTGGPAPVWLPVFSPDGSKVAYSVGNLRQKVAVWVIPSTGGTAQQLCDECGIAYDWSLDGKWLVIRSTGQPRQLWLLNTATGERRILLQHPNYSFYGPQVSPDNRWLATYARSGPHHGTLLVAPFRTDGLGIGEQEWMLVANEKTTHVACRWSPDGNVLYFTSNREGPTCIWAQRLAPGTRRPMGDPWPVHHAHSARFTLGVYMPVDLAIDLSRFTSGARMVFPMIERTGNIWMVESKEAK